MAGSDHLLSKAFLLYSGGGWASANATLGQCVVVRTGTTLDPNQVDLAGATAGSAQAASPVGLLQENMDNAKILTGKAYASVAVAGIAWALVTVGAVTIGSALTPDNSNPGQLTPLTIPATASQKPVVGIALQAIAAGGSGANVLAVLLTPGQRA